jgi:hypothetical protein
VLLNTCPAGRPKSSVKLRVRQAEQKEGDIRRLCGFHTADTCCVTETEQHSRTTAKGTRRGILVVHVGRGQGAAHSVT